jgi:hypothetical protein
MNKATIDRIESAQELARAAAAAVAISSDPILLGLAADAVSRHAHAMRLLGIFLAQRAATLAAIRDLDRQIELNGFGVLFCADCQVEPLLMSDAAMICAHCRALRMEMLIEDRRP